MTPDLLELARRRRDALRRDAAFPPREAASDCEISEKSEESQAEKGLISHNSLFSQSVPTGAVPDDLLIRARAHVRELRGDATINEVRKEDRAASIDRPVARAATGCPTEPDCEISEKRSDEPPGSGLIADPFRAWRLRNAELLTEAKGRLGHDYGGFCATHRRPLSRPEQQRGACSWCVPVDPEREPEFWASHWRRFSERP